MVARSKFEWFPVLKRSPAACVHVIVITGKTLGLRRYRQRKQHRKLQMKGSVVYDEDSVISYSLFPTFIINDTTWNLFYQKRTERELFRG